MYLHFYYPIRHIRCYASDTKEISHANIRPPSKYEGDILIEIAWEKWDDSSDGYPSDYWEYEYIDREWYERKCSKLQDKNW